MNKRKGRLRRNRLNAIHLIAIGFAGIILLGSLLLSLPCATLSGESIGWFDALFTSTSASWKRTRMSTMGTITPRRFITPFTKDGALAMRVGGS